MKYFFMKTDPLFTVAPDLLNWYQTYTVRYINQQNHHKLPKRKLFWIRSLEETVFTDVVSFPFLLVSQVVKEVIDLYHPHIPYKQIVLLDAENRLVELYYLPILEKLDCLSEASILTLDKSGIKKAVIDPSKTKNKSLFKVDILDHYYVVRLDLMESILRRNVRGVGFEEIELDKNSYDSTILDFTKAKK